MGTPTKKAPSGPYADKLWREALRRAVLKRVNKELNLDRLARSTVALALGGDMAATKEIGDRLDGKPNQTQDVNVTQRMVVEAPLPAKTTEEWLERAGRPAVH